MEGRRALLLEGGAEEDLFEFGHGVLLWEELSGSQAGHGVGDMNDENA